MPFWRGSYPIRKSASGRILWWIRRTASTPYAPESATFLLRLPSYRSDDPDSRFPGGCKLMREIVLDTETTVLDPLRGDRLVEIGCVEIFNRMPTGQTFHRHLNPERDMPAEAF